MDFAIEPLAQCWDEIMALAEGHWQETEAHHHEQGFNPKRERYEQYEKPGWYVQFTARVDGRLIGFAGMYLVPSMHSQALIATEDTWYLAPDYRGKGRTFMRFYAFIEAEMKRRGAVEINMSVPIVGAASRLLEALDYQPVKVHYCKLLRADSPQARFPLTVGDSPHAVFKKDNRPFP
jgi:GNAT superfamily N-acetyltransferase